MQQPMSTEEGESDEERRATKERRAKMTLRELLEETTTDGGGVQLEQGVGEGRGTGGVLTSTQISEHHDASLELDVSLIE